MSYNYQTEVPINNNASSTVRSLSVDHPDNQFLEGFRQEVGLHELEDLMDEVIIRFDTNPSNYLKDDYLHLIALIIKEFDRLSSLHEKVSILESTDVDIKGNIESNLDRIEEVRGLVINLNTDLRSINNTIRVINNNIDALQAKDSIFTKSIEDINTSIQKHIEDYSKEIKDINTTIEQLNTNIDTIDSNIEKLFNRKVSEGASVENYVCLSVESDADDNTIITLDDTLLKQELDTVDNNISNINTKITEISNVLGKVYKVKGSTTVDNINSMTVGTAMIGYVYNLLDSGVITNGINGELNVVKGGNIVYTEEGWDEFAVSLDLDLDQCAGDNISIEGNIISALGYTYDKEKEAFSVGEGNATGQNSYAEGQGTTAAGLTSHAEGSNTTASGDLSHTEGFVTVANNAYEHAQGSLNVSNTGTTPDKQTIHSIGIGANGARKNAQEVMQNGDHYIIGIGGYDGTNATDEEVKTLQEVIEDISSASGGGETYTAGDNISIENGTISTLGYEFDNELNSFRIGREVTQGEMDQLFPATLSMGDTPTIFTDDVVASWQKGTNILQFTEDQYNGIATIVPGTVLQLNTNSDKLICKIVDRDPELYKVILDKDIPFDYIENVSKIAFLYGVAYGKCSVANPVNTASGVLSHAGGCATTAGGWASHTEGIITYAIGDSSHAEGIGSVAYEQGSHAEGMITKAYGVGSHTEGGQTVAEGELSHAEGIGTQTKHEAEHAEGKYNVSNTTDWIGDTIHSVGIGTSHEDRKNALEVTTQGAVYMTGVGGYEGTTLAECYPVQLVINALLDSKNNDIPAINKRIDDLNIPTLPENIVNTVNGQTGDVTIDISGFATTEEVQAVNTRIDELNIPADLSNVVTKTDDHQLTLGTDNNSTHEKTLLVGTGLTTSNNESLVVGAYNNSEYFASWGVDAPAIQVGAGTEDSKRTVMVVQKNGKSSGLLGFEQNGFGDFAEYFEWADGNPEGEDRVGYMVQLNEDKIELAESLDNCIGIITGTGAFVADAACLDWHGRYLKDKWGRNIYALTGVLAENPEYDPTKEYIPREYRKEWSPVGLVGKILVRQDGTLKPNGFVGCVNGIATNVDKSSWRVLKVIDEEIALVLIK